MSILLKSRPILSGSLAILVGLSLTLVYRAHHRKVEAEQGAQDELESRFTTLRQGILRKIRTYSEESLNGQFLQKDSWLYRAEITLGAKGLEKLIASTKNTNFPSTQARFFESILLGDLQKNLNVSHLRQYGVTAFPVHYRAEGAAPGQNKWMGFAILKATAGSSPISRAIITIRPDRWINELLQSASEATDKDLYRSFLLSLDGKIAFHNQTALIQTDFQKTDVYQNWILLHQAATSRPEVSPVAFPSLDQLPAFAAVQNLEPWPWFLVMERVDRHAAFRLPNDETSNFPVGAIFIATGVLLLSGTAWKRFRNCPKKFLATSLPVGIPEASFGEEVTGIPVTIHGDEIIVGFHAPAPPPVHQIPDDQKEALQALAQFENHARRIQDPRVIASLLASTAEKLCESPTLFFRYNPSISVAFLETDSGLESTATPAELSFPIHSGAYQRILDCTRRGKLASLANYEPLSKQVMERWKVAFFEAWAVPRMDAQQRIHLMGILVILQSGVLSSTRRDLLVRMMRTMAVYYDPKEKSPTASL